jgi:hypothetical protein
MAPPDDACGHAVVLVRIDWRPAAPAKSTFEGAEVDKSSCIQD